MHAFDAGTFLRSLCTPCTGRHLQGNTVSHFCTGLLKILCRLPNRTLGTTAGRIMADAAGEAFSSFSGYGMGGAWTSVTSTACTSCGDATANYWLITLATKPSAMNSFASYVRLAYQQFPLLQVGPFADFLNSSCLSLPASLMCLMHANKQHDWCSTWAICCSGLMQVMPAGECG